MCSTDKLKLFCNGHVKEVRMLLATHGYIIDILALAKLPISEPVIRLMEDQKSKDSE